MIKILFVCLGNICRSPMAEAIFAKKVKDRGLSSKISCDSAGTANYHLGDNPDHRTIKVATLHQVPIQHKGQQFKRADGDSFDYLIAMDASNMRNMLHELSYRHEGLYLMRDFDAEALGTDVPDPYYGDMRDFEEVYQILDRASEEFLEFIIKTHNL